jgi:hypothetical protein
MKSHPACNDELIFASPSIIWQGMSATELEAEFRNLQSRKNAIDCFVKHLTTSSICDFQKYEEFCDTMLAAGVNPNLWIDGVLENIDYEIEALIENANR